MFNAHEVTNEYNLLNDFLSTSLQDDGMYSNDEFTASYNDPSLINSMASSLGGSNGHLPLNYQQNQPPLTVQNTAQQAAALRQTSSIPLEKAKETYYMTAADPSGTDPPEERMDKLLKAKYDAGLLKPFNYVKGYARLQQYMDQHMQPSSKQKILRQLDRFRPKFRERMHSLTDIELVLVEMWFERSLMEYDRVFASMAIPACCWRRTGEIFRGNKEMAELIHVPIDSFRDVSVKAALYQCLLIELPSRASWQFTRSSSRISSSVIGRSLGPLRSTVSRKLCLQAAPLRIRMRKPKIKRSNAAFRLPFGETITTCKSYHGYLSYLQFLTTKPLALP